MKNPVTFQMLSKIENQRRARQVSHIQKLNLAENSRTDKLPKFTSIKLVLVRAVRRISLLPILRVEKRSAAHPVAPK